MPIVHSNFPTNLFVPTATPSSEIRVGASVRLQLEQMVQAFVVEADNDRTVLELGSQRYQVPGKSDLQVGEKLTLQVQQVEPQLEFRVLSTSVNNRLAQTLPSLAQPFNWGELVARLQSLAAEGRLPQSAVTVLNQLEEILISPVPPTELKEQFGQIISQLRQLIDPNTELFIGAQAISSPTVSSLTQTTQLSAETELLQAIVSLVKNLQNQLAQTPQSLTGESVKELPVDVKSLLSALSSGRDVSQLKSMVLPVLDRISQSPDLSPRLVAEIQHILSEIDSQNSQIVTATVGGRPSSIVASGGVVTPLSLQVDGSTEWLKVSAEIKDLLGQISQLKEKGVSASPDLLGRLEGLQLRLQAVEGVARPLPGVEALLGQINQLVSQPATVFSGEKLGILSQLFGLHFETGLLDGKKKAALISLKSCLLELQQDGDDVKDPLRRLELFQLCKAKLAENHVQFLPLPFAELEEGYLLAEKQEETTDFGGEEPPLQMSLSLRLSALGNIRIDILYEPDGLHLRLAGDGSHKMDYLKSCRGELEEALQAVELKGVSFSADAGLPARQLQERLLPESLNMFDTRV